MTTEEMQQRIEALENEVRQLRSMIECPTVIHRGFVNTAKPSRDDLKIVYQTVTDSILEGMERTRLP